MNTIALVVTLYESFSFLNILELKVHERNPTQAYWKIVSLTHSTVTLTLHTKSDSVKKQLSELYLQASFNVQDGSMVLNDLYCADGTRKDELQTYILNHAPKRFDTLSAKIPPVFTEEVIAYLQSAEEIAKQGYQCAPGDNYYPGYFSEMIIEETQIVLKQINRWNSRSIDHKKDYHMRDLELYIPLTLDAIEKNFMNEEVGRMILSFSDHSSPNNKACGDKIAEQIKAEKVKYLSKTK